MCPGDAGGRARADVAAARHRPLLDRLKSAVANDPADLPAREHLAEMYRSLGYSDQAARWGAALPGWLTRTERAVLARTLRGAPRDRVRTLMMLPSGMSLPEDVDDLLFSGTPDDRRWRWRVATHLDTALRFLVLFAGAAIAFCVVLIVGAAFAGASDIRLMTRVMAVTCAIPLLCTDTLWLLRSLLTLRWWVVPVTVAVGIPLVLMIVWIAPTPGGYLPWE
ncbi:DUF6584 family protein [Microbacterium sp. SORGH_AS_0888]|uniref:DUF6584 family protein n=1 Tax=Microbacterium sp. SORGH_AS_0888 TaxID=3041791 RepID=UPI002783902C|nr:DUF6584 family protein [Microbacterium sp. SORGH_AS_0888]MDQ1130379.1 hypothetical protein [Microbacterium sp. SORGH_AS_0888]